MPGSRRQHSRNGVSVWDVLIPAHCFLDDGPVVSRGQVPDSSASCAWLAAGRRGNGQRLIHGSPTYVYQVAGRCLCLASSSALKPCALPTGSRGEPGAWAMLLGRALSLACLTCLVDNGVIMYMNGAPPFGVLHPVLVRISKFVDATVRDCGVIGRIQFCGSGERPSLRLGLGALLPGLQSA
jgi:hypothetical protein